VGPEREVADSAVGSASASSYRWCGATAFPPGRRQRLDRHPDDVVERLLRLERDPAGLGVEADGRSDRRLEPLAHQPGPEPSRGAELGRLLEEIVVAREEEREPGTEAVHREPASTATRTYSSALARVNPISWAAVAPASRMW
jgi:hypothetical protein